jgi:3-(3-hydroxy-phenyl)propionate hydroxylase
MDDAPMQEDGAGFWLLDRVGNRFMALVQVDDPGAVDADLAREFKALSVDAIPVEVVLVSGKPGRAPEGLRVFADSGGRFAERYDSAPGTVYLIRPDQHVAARWRAFDASRVRAALARATCNTI